MQDVVAGSTDDSVSAMFEHVRHLEADLHCIRRENSRLRKLLERRAATEGVDVAQRRESYEAGYVAQALRALGWTPPARVTLQVADPDEPATEVFLVSSRRRTTTTTTAKRRSPASEVATPWYGCFATCQDQECLTCAPGGTWDVAAPRSSSSFDDDEEPPSDRPPALITTAGASPPTRL